MKRWRLFPRVPTVRIASDGFIPRWAERKRTVCSISTRQALIWCASRTNAAVTGCPLSDLIRKVFKYDLVYEVRNPQSASFELSNQKLKIYITHLSIVIDQFKRSIPRIRNPVYIVYYTRVSLFSSLIRRYSLKVYEFSVKAKRNIAAIYELQWLRVAHLVTMK